MFRFLFFGQNPNFFFVKKFENFVAICSISKKKMFILNWSFRLWTNHTYHIIYYIKMYLKFKVTIFVEGPMLKKTIKTNANLCVIVSFVASWKLNSYSNKGAIGTIVI